MEPLHVGRGAHPTAPEAGALPETGRCRAKRGAWSSFRPVGSMSWRRRPCRRKAWMVIDEVARPGERNRTAAARHPYLGDFEGRCGAKVREHLSWRMGRVASLQGSQASGDAVAVSGGDGGGFAAEMGRLRRAIPTLGFSRGAAAPVVAITRRSESAESIPGKIPVTTG